MTSYNVVVIGLGKIGMYYGFDKKRIQPASHVAAILSNYKMKLLAVSDVDRKVRGKFLKSYGSKIAVFSDYTELVWQIKKKENVDIIVLATQDNQHYEMLMKILGILASYSKPLIIFCEKPITIDSAKAKKIKKFVKNKNIYIVVNHSRRWSKVWNKAFVLLKKIGKIQRAEFVFSTSPENINLDQLRDGIHVADIMSWFNIEKQTRISRLDVPYFVYEFYVWGTNGKMEILDVGEKINFYLAKKSKKFEGFDELSLIKSTVLSESMLKNTYSEFVDFLNGKKSLSTGLNDAVKSMEVFEKYVYDKTLTKARRKI